MRDLFHPSIHFRKRPNRALKPKSISHSGESITGNVPVKMTGSTIPLPNSDLQLAPTLTNPDMILPHKDESSISVDKWTNGPNEKEIDSNDIKISSDLGLIISRTPFVYGAGTILSDIGEVTEAENTPNRTKPVSIDKKSSRPLYGISNRKLSLTNSLGSESHKKRVDLENHRRQVSNESITSDASNKQSNFIFTDFKDDISVDDSVFQGDDEESLVNSDSDETIAPDKRDSWKEWDEFDFDENSSAALSRKAEQILQNAKKRLNSMEDNLHRARTSFNQRQSNSASPIRSFNSLTRSTPSPSLSEGRRSELFDNIYPLKKQRESLSSLSSYGPFESRRPNQRTSSQSSLVTSIASVGPQSESRSKNGSPSTFGSSELIVKDRKVSPSLSTHSKDSSSSILLDPRSENHNEPKIEILQRPDNRISEKDANYLGDIRVLTRSASSLQMRDIEYQVEGLKGRLSRLRNRAKDDSVRRRSLQFFKTPTAIREDQNFNSSSKNYQNNELFNVESCAAQPYPEDLSEKIEDAEELGFDSSKREKYYHDETDSAQNFDFDKSINDRANNERSEITETDLDNVENEETCDDENPEDSENDSCLYYDATVSHEDREDAFDYENFFLHSALGTIGQQRRDSLDSEGSMETTRGFQVLSPRNLNSIESQGIHLRSTSTDTLSTMASFETAIESLGDDDYYETNNGDDFAVQYFQSHQEINHGSGFDRFSDQTFENKNTEELQILKPYSSEYVHNFETLPQRSSPNSVNFYNSHQQSGNKIGFFIASKMPKRRSCKASFYLHDTSDDQRLNSEIKLSSNFPCNPLPVDRNEIQSLDLFPKDIISSEDQILVRRLLNSFGECVLGLQEADNIRDCRVWRRRLDAARRILESEEGPV